MKFGRSYQMSLTGQSGAEIEIGFPITMEFNIVHDIWASANHAEFSFYNLSATNRYEIYFNQYLKPRLFPMTLHAGYISQRLAGLLGMPSSLPVVFKGYANVAYTERVGSDLITRIDAFDHGDFMGSKAPSYLASGVNAYTAPIGTTWITMVLSLIEKLNDVQIGDIIVDPSLIPGPLTKPRVFNGNVWENLQALARDAGNADLFIENGVCNMLGQTKSLSPNNLGILKSSTGLLGIPKYTGPTVICSSIFEPSLSIGASIELESSATPWVNGPYKIIAYTHHGTISGIDSGDAISDITLSSLNTSLVVPLSAGPDTSQAFT